eukprot:UN02031
MSDPVRDIARSVGLVMGAVTLGWGVYALAKNYISPFLTGTQQPTTKEQEENNDEPQPRGENNPNDNEYTHMDPDSLDEVELEQLNTQFNLATEFMNSRHAKSLTLNNEDRLRLYAYYKQATKGPNDTPKPGMLDFERTAMWNAWSQLKGVSKVEAKIAYVEFVHKLNPNWRDCVTSKALGQILGENATLTCDPDQSDPEQDEADKLYEAERKKTTEQLDRDHAERVETKKREENRKKTTIIT